MSVPARKIDDDLIYNKVKNNFSIDFLKTTLSIEISRLIIFQKNTINILDEMIENLKKRPLNGGL